MNNALGTTSSKAKKLVEYGVPVRATIVNTEMNTMVSVNGRHPYRFICQGTLPSGEICYFESGNVYIRLQPNIIGQPITVYVDPDDYSFYYVDVSAYQTKGSKNTKKFIIIFAAVFGVALLIGLIAFGRFASNNAAKTALSRREFIEKSETYGLYTINIDDLHDLSSEVISATAAGKVENNDYLWYATFYDFKSKEKAIERTDQVMDNLSSSSVSSSFNSDHFTSFKIKSYNNDGTDEYIYLSRIDNTVLFIEIDAQYTNAAEGLVEALGY